MHFLLQLYAWISGRINEVKNKEKCTSGIKKVVVGRINGVVALTGCFYKNMYGRFAGPKKSGRNNEVVVRRGSTVSLTYYRNPSPVIRRWRIRDKANIRNCNQAFGLVQLSLIKCAHIYKISNPIIQTGSQLHNIKTS